MVKQWLREALSCYEIKTEQELEQAPFIEMTVEYGKQMVKGYLEQAEHYHELCQDVDTFICMRKPVSRM